MAIEAIEQRSFAALPQLGKLRKGDVKGQRGPGKDLDTFRFTADDPRVMAAFVAAYGSDRPSEVRVYLPYARLRSCWDYFYETWAGRFLKVRCDGVHQTKWLLPDGKSYSREPRLCPICAGQQAAAAGEHKVTGRLVVVLPELLRAGFAGVVMVETHSITDVYSINGAFRALDDNYPEVPLNRIELRLSRQIRTVNTKEHGPRRLAVITMEPLGEWVLAQLEQAKTAPTSTGGRVIGPGGEILGGLEERDELEGEDDDDELDLPLDDDPPADEPPPDDLDQRMLTGELPDADPLVKQEVRQTKQQRQPPQAKTARPETLDAFSETKQAEWLAKVRDYYRLTLDQVFEALGTSRKQGGIQRLRIKPEEAKARLNTYRLALDMQAAEEADAQEREQQAKTEAMQQVEALTEEIPI